MSRGRRINVGAVLAFYSTGALALAGGGFARAIDAALPRTVKLYGLKVGRQVGYGAGTLVSADGYVLTVYTLLLESEKLRAVTTSGVRYHAKLVDFDRNTQLALVKITGPMEEGVETESFPYFELRRSATTQETDAAASGGEPNLFPGDWVVATGNPFKVAEGAEPASIAHGVYSTRTRLDARRKVNEFPYHGDVLVIDAVTSNPGAPGGPLVNLDGELLGMIGRVVVSNRTHTRLNYAIPRDVLRDFVAQATGSQDTHQATAPRLAATGRDALERVDPGIRLTRTGYMRLPPFVERVQRGSPAARAGVRKDDLILSVNGHSVPDVAGYDERIGRIRPDEPIDLVIQRKKTVLTVRIEPETARQRDER